MRKLALVSIAAAGAALLPTAAAAQPGPAPGAHMPPAGHTWRHGDPRAGMPPRGHMPRHAPPHHGAPPPHAGAPHQGWVFPPHWRGPRFGHIPRFHRGHRMAHVWFGPQFHVRNWQLYGLHQPQPGHRWVRHYDDAYLIDGQGMVMDGRYGLDWDQHGEPWGYDSGIPQYVGSGDFHPDGRDHAWVEEHGQLGYAHHQQGYGYGHQAVSYGGGRMAYPYPAGHGGCGCVVTETTVTTQPVVTQRTYVTEEVVETVHTRRRAPVRRAPARIAPVKGERG
jgi:Ni/Co efflux regulator RcnB